MKSVEMCLSNYCMILTMCITRNASKGSNSVSISIVSELLKV